MLKTRTAAGTPLLFSSHQLDLVERLCDGLVILSHGRVVAQGGREELRDRGTNHYRLTMTSDTGWVRDAPGTTVLDVAGPTALLSFDSDRARQGLLRAAIDHGDVIELALVRPSLADIYREVTK